MLDNPQKPKNIIQAFSAIGNEINVEQINVAFQVAKEAKKKLLSLVFQLNALATGNINLNLLNRGTKEIEVLFDKVINDCRINLKEKTDYFLGVQSVNEYLHDPKQSLTKEELVMLLISVKYNSVLEESVYKKIVNKQLKGIEKSISDGLELGSLIPVDSCFIASFFNTAVWESDTPPTINDHPKGNLIARLVNNGLLNILNGLSNSFNCEQDTKKSIELQLFLLLLNFIHIEPSLELYSGAHRYNAPNKTQHLDISTLLEEWKSIYSILLIYMSGVAKGIESSDFCNVSLIDTEQGKRFVFNYSSRMQTLQTNETLYAKTSIDPRTKAESEYGRIVFSFPEWNPKLKAFSTTVITHYPISEEEFGKQKI